MVATPPSGAQEWRHRLPGNGPGGDRGLPDAQV